MSRTNFLSILALVTSLFIYAFPGSALGAEPMLVPSRLAAQWIDGRPVSLEEGRGKTSLVIFWSPTSLASRKSLPELQRFADAPESRGIFLLAVCTVRDPAAVQDFMAARALNFPNALRGDDDFGIIEEQRLPVAYVFDTQGRLLRRHAGLFNLKTLDRLIDPDLP